MIKKMEKKLKIEEKTLKNDKNSIKTCQKIEKISITHKKNMKMIKHNNKNTKI